MDTLVCDAGSTKSRWVLLDGGGRETARLEASGINGLVTPDADLEKTMSAVGRGLPHGCEIGAVHYYGSGCATPLSCKRIETALRDYALSAHGDSETAVVEVNSDLLGAARSLLGKNRGIACILGTGSNSCLYDGKGIARNIPSLGYILGDEGSGAALGKRLLREVLRGGIPERLSRRFLDGHRLSLPAVLDKVYRESSPNRFLASFVPFIADNITEPSLREVVLKEFDSFIHNNIKPYPDSAELPVCFTGGVAWTFREILSEALASAGLNTGTITPDPLEGMAAFHRDSIRNSIHAQNRTC